MGKRASRCTAGSCRNSSLQSQRSLLPMGRNPVDQAFGISYANERLSSDLLQQWYGTYASCLSYVDAVFSPQATRMRAVSTFCTTNGRGQITTRYTLTSVTLLSQANIYTGRHLHRVPQPYGPQRQKPWQCGDPSIKNYLHLAGLVGLCQHHSLLHPRTSRTAAIQDVKTPDRYLPPVGSTHAPLPDELPSQEEWLATQVDTPSDIGGDANILFNPCLQITLC